MSVLEAKSVLPKYYEKTLDNGLQVVVIPLNNKSDVINTSIFYKVGSRNEVMGKSGIAHMLEHLSFKSTKNLKAGEFDEIVKGFGGVNNASTSFDYTRYFIGSTKQNLDKSLELFADLMSNLSLKDSEFQPERAVVLEERRWRTDNSPIGYLYFRFFNTAFIEHSYHWTPIGFSEDIKNWKIEDIKKFYKKYYQPNNAIVVVAGDVKKEAVFKAAKKHFSKIKNHTDFKFSPIIEPEQDGYREVIIKKDSKLEWIALGYKIPNFESSDQTALNALASLLNDSSSALLDSILIDKKNLASEVSAYPMALKDSGVFMILSAGNIGIKAKTLQKEIIAILDSVKNGVFTESDLDRVKLNAKVDFLQSLNKANSVAGIYGGYLVKGNIAPLLNREKELENLTLEDIKRVANKYFIDKNLSVAILQPESKTRSKK